MKPTDTLRLPLSEPEVAVLDRLAGVQRGCLAMVAATVAVNLVEWFVPSLGQALASNWRPLSLQAAAASVFCAAALYVSSSRFSPRVRAAGVVLSALVVLGSATLIAGHLVRIYSGFDARIPAGDGTWFSIPARMSLGACVCFALLGLSILTSRASRRAALWTADFLVFCLSVLVLTVTSAQIIVSLRVFGPPTPLDTSPQTLLCLLLLSAVAFLRQARKGVFSILLGRGMGSRIARALAPILLAVPYLREAARARIIGNARMPDHYVTALLATLAVGISMLLLLYLAWRFNGMEAEIHDLSLRDELTGLYNLRGFRLLAGQALLLARRSGEPFSLLFVDLDDLKRINDVLGHQTGSDFLVETADILKEAFRETDVLARIGGDEFAVAGQFSRTAIAFAADRLGDSAARRNAETDRKIPLSFSVGQVTAEPTRRDSLEVLLAQADESMYQEKRRRKAESQSSRTLPPASPLPAPPQKIPQNPLA